MSNFKLRHHLLLHEGTFDHVGPDSIRSSQRFATNKLLILKSDVKHYKETDDAGSNFIKISDKNISGLFLSISLFLAVRIDFAIRFAAAKSDP